MTTKTPITDAITKGGITMSVEGDREYVRKLFEACRRAGTYADIKVIPPDRIPVDACIDPQEVFFLGKTTEVETNEAPTPATVPPVATPPFVIQGDGEVEEVSLG